jgi:hypothetical protein
MTSLLEHRAEKWIRFSAPDDALIHEESIGFDPKSAFHFWVRCFSPLPSSKKAAETPLRQLVMGSGLRFAEA